MPSLHSVTLCRCYAHIFFTLPLLRSFILCSAVAVRCHASPLQSLLGGSTQCRCSASPSIRYHAVAARGFSQLGFAVASQCNALRALPLHNCSLPSLYQSSPSHLMSKLSRSFATLSQSTPILCRSFHTIAVAFRVLPGFASAIRSLRCPCSAQLCYAMPLPLRTPRCSAVAAHCFSSLLLCWSSLSFSVLCHAVAAPSISGRCLAFALKARTRPCSLRSARTRTCP